MDGDKQIMSQKSKKIVLDTRFYYLYIDKQITSWLRNKKEDKKIPRKGTCHCVRGEIERERFGTNIKRVWGEAKEKKVKQVRPQRCTSNCNNRKLCQKMFSLSLATMHKFTSPHLRFLSLSTMWNFTVNKCKFFSSNF